MRPIEVTKADGIDLLSSMWRIRAFEEKVSELYARGKVSGLLHLGIGQEAVAVGASHHLNRDDYTFGGHRSHAHALAKGANPEKLIAELAGRATGYCRGKGGSMHISALDVGFVTATGVVGGNLPLALGAALRCRELNEHQIAVAFFGDGAGQTGALHESLNIAALWKLPILFICENNGYAEFTPLSAHTVVERLANYAATYGIPGVTVDGNDVLAVREAVLLATAHARRGEGASFIECLTYRLRGHYEGDAAKYRELSELDEWRDRDPIRRFETKLALAGLVSAEEATDIQGAARLTVEEASHRALNAPLPSITELTTQVFAE
jgi:pyruvate dehydrogenase E1 component alpha subunit